jgi:hypothetical protein
MKGKKAESPRLVPRWQLIAMSIYFAITFLLLSFMLYRFAYPPEFHYTDPEEHQNWTCVHFPLASYCCNDKAWLVNHNTVSGVDMQVSDCHKFERADSPLT